MVQWGYKVIDLNDSYDVRKDSSVDLFLSGLSNDGYIIYKVEFEFTEDHRNCHILYYLPPQGLADVTHITDDDDQIVV